MRRGIHTNAPLREVAVIETMDGERGAKLWKLTLSCGHRAFRPQRPITPGNILEPIERKLAPKRVRCLFCKDNATTKG